MDDTAYREYAEESADWLKSGRASLLEHLVRRYATSRTANEILEVGAGVGQNLPILSALGTVDACELNEVGQAAIRTQGIVRDLFTSALPFQLDRSYDVVCAMDVVEHIEDDRSALAWIADHLRPGGVFIATVPAYPWLFSDHDRALHHFRRYTKTSFTRALPDTLLVETAAYFNHLLFPIAVAARGAWSLKRLVTSPSAGAKQRSPKTGPAALVLGKVLGAEVALVERGYRPPWGLSVFCVARRR